MSDASSPQVERAVDLIRERLRELSDERESLDHALGSLEANERSPRIAMRRPRVARGQRRQEFLATVRTHPGAAITAIAREMGVAPQQLYPIAHHLTAMGSVEKRGGGYVVT